MAEVTEGIRAGGREVFAFAPTAEAVHDVLRPEGYQAETVARLLVDPALQSRVRGQVVWIDEAGQLGARTMHRLLAIAKQQDARVILTGDTRQHAAVERGDALRLLEHAAGIRPADVRSIRRQQGVYREAIAKLVDGKVVDGFDTLDRMGAVIECDEVTRHQQLADAYVQAIGEGGTALVVSPTHAEGARVTQAIRAALKEQGGIEAAEHPATRLLSTDLTEAQRADAVHYREGQVVGFHQNVAKKDGGFRKGEKCIVSRVERGMRGDEPRIMVQRESGESVALPFSHADRFQVFEPEAMTLSVGDRLRFTRNGMTADGKHRLVNGNIHTLKGFTKGGDLILDNGWTVPRDYGHLAHGYCTTSHASQGKTVDRVFIAMSESSFAASSREQFYVSASRARHEVRIFTDDKDALREAVQRSEQRWSALEMSIGRPISASPIKQIAKKKARLSRYARLKADIGREERTRERPRVERAPIIRDLGRGR